MCYVVVGFVVIILGVICSCWKFGSELEVIGGFYWVVTR